MLDPRIPLTSSGVPQGYGLCHVLNVLRESWMWNLNFWSKPRSASIQTAWLQMHARAERAERAVQHNCRKISRLTLFGYSLQFSV